MATCRVSHRCWDYRERVASGYPLAADALICRFPAVASLLLAASLTAVAARRGRLFTPEGNASSVVTCFSTRDPREIRSAFERAKIDVTVRDALKQVRVSPALFNTKDDVAQMLEVMRRLR